MPRRTGNWPRRPATCPLATNEGWRPAWLVLRSTRSSPRTRARVARSRRGPPDGPPAGPPAGCDEVDPDWGVADRGGLGPELGVVRAPEPAADLVRPQFHVSQDPAGLGRGDPGAAGFGGDHGVRPLRAVFRRDGGGGGHDGQPARTPGQPGRACRRGRTGAARSRQCPARSPAPRRSARQASRHGPTADRAREPGARHRLHPLPRQSRRPAS